MGRVEEMVMVIVIREEVMVIMTVRVGREEEAGEMAGQEEAAREGMVGEVAGEVVEEVVEELVAEEEEARLQSPVGGSRLLTRACETPTSTLMWSCTRYVMHNT